MRQTFTGFSFYISPKLELPVEAPTWILGRPQVTTPDPASVLPGAARATGANAEPSNAEVDELLENWERSS